MKQHVPSGLTTQPMMPRQHGSWHKLLERNSRWLPASPLKVSLYSQQPQTAPPALTVCLESYTCYACVTAVPVHKAVLLPATCSCCQPWCIALVLNLSVSVSAIVGSAFNRFLLLHPPRPAVDVGMRVLAYAMMNIFTVVLGCFGYRSSCYDAYWHRLCVLFLV